MDFLDDLDKAFDNMLADSDEEQHQEESVEHGHLDLGDLRGELMREHLAPVAVLAADADSFQRRYLLAALAGGVNHLLAVVHHPEREVILQGLAAHLRTRKGLVRKVMAQPQRERLAGMLQELCDHFGELSDHEASELLLTLQKGGVDLDVVFALFSSGISCPRMMQKAPEHEIAHITHLDPETISGLKVLFGGP